MVLADGMRYFPESKWKFPFAVFISIFYLLMDYNLLSVRYQITPLETYLAYYQNNTRSILLGIKNVLSSLNMLIFLVYIILLVRIQLNEKKRILGLNQELNHVNEELKQANIKLEEYAKESEKAAEARERNRLAREIHDTLGHALTGIITGIEACTSLMDVAPEATGAAKGNCGGGQAGSYRCQAFGKGSEARRIRKNGFGKGVDPDGSGDTFCYQCRDFLSVQHTFGLL